MDCGALGWGNWCFVHCGRRFFGDGWMDGWMDGLGGGMEYLGWRAGSVFGEGREEYGTVTETEIGRVLESGCG